MKNKKLLIIVLIILVVLLLALGGVTFAYLKTDIFKTDKQLFYKYLGQVLEKTENFESKKLTNYYEKLETTPYENNGKLSVNVSLPEELNFDLNKVNNLNLTFSGKTDKINEKKEQKIQLNYTDDISFPIEYRKVGNIIGITSDLIITKYVAVDLDRIEELLTKLGITRVDTKGLLTLAETDINEEQIKAESQKYKQILLNNIKETNFSKVDENSFALTLNEQEFLTLIVEMLKELRTSSFISEEYKAQIDDILENIDITRATMKEFIKITVNKQGTVKIAIEEAPEIIIQTVQNGLNISISEDEVRVTLELTKVENESQVAYRINALIESTLDENETSEISGNIYFNIAYSNLESQNVTEKYNFGIELENKEDEDIQTISYDYTLDKTNTFVDKVEVADLNSNTAEILNDKDATYIQAVMTIIAGQFEKVYASQMQSLGVEDNQNPIIYATPLGLYMIIHENLMNQVIESTNKPMTADEKDTFNVVFVSYQGIQTGSTVKTLINRVMSSNIAYTDRIIKVNGVSEIAELTALNNEIDETKTYTVTCNINRRNRFS